MARKPIAVDLFAGTGGLSLGLRKAGFSVKAAVELDEDAAKTYRMNHRGTSVFISDVSEITGAKIKAAVGDRRIDLLVGCAPCQGFCSLTRKNHRRDPRNRLLLEMARLIKTLRPSAVLMENVPGLADVGKHVFGQFLRALRESGYTYDWRIIQMANYGLPQSRQRLVLLAGRGFGIAFPEPTHTRMPKKGSKLKPWVSVRDAIGGKRAPITLSQASKRGGPQAVGWHVVRDLREHTKARLRAARPGQSHVALDEELLPECHKDGYDGFGNVYGRMSWESPSPTITGGCVTPCKGRFGHPDRRRMTISVREAALLQTFPARYKFHARGMDAASEMIGNAVPPLFANVLGRQLIRSLSDNDGRL
jgi:DNA (cytosine-5)-methyltransferase 1